MTHSDAGTPRGPDPGAPVVPVPADDDAGLTTRAMTIALAVATFGVSFGVLAVAAGLSPSLAVLTSIIVFAGASQFALVGAIAAGASPLFGVLGGLLLNLRMLALGAAVGARLPTATLGRRLLDGYLLIDESAAVALSGPAATTGRRLRTVGIAVWIGWVGATAVGAYAGDLLGDLERYGLDATFPATFLALLAPWLRQRRLAATALLGAGIALLAWPVAAPGVPLMLAVMAVLPVLLADRLARRAAVPR
ncbi:MAG: hypothetical protein RLZZ272_1221 [Actinomycetota bacterium]